MNPPGSRLPRILPPSLWGRVTRRTALLPGAALLVLAAYGPGWFALAWTLLCAGRLASGIPESLRLPGTLICGLTALLGPQPAGWALLAAGGLLFSMEGYGLACRLLPAMALPAVLLDGSLTGLEVAAAVTLPVAFLPRGAVGRLLGFGGMVAGLLLLGPPRPSQPVPFSPDRLAVRYPQYDWHDPLSVDMGCPDIVVIPPGAPASLLVLFTEADLPGDGEAQVTAWISMDDTLQRVDSGTGRYRLPTGSGPLRLSLSGVWRPFSSPRVVIQRVGEVTP